MSASKQKRMINIFIPIALVLVVASVFIFSYFLLNESAKNRNAVFAKTDSDTGVSLVLNGNSSGILDTSVTEIKDFRDVGGILCTYAIASRATAGELTVTIPYANFLTNAAFYEFLTISRYDPDTATLYDLETSVDGQAQTATATANRTGIFCLRLDHNPEETIESLRTDILFLLGSSVQASLGAMQMVDLLSGMNARFSVASYLDGYSLHAGFTDGTQTTKAALEAIRAGNQTGKAHLAGSFIQAAEEFSDASDAFHRQFIVFVTDNNDQSGTTALDEQMQRGIDRCRVLGIRVMTLQVGDKIDNAGEYWLKRIAEQTEGTRYQIRNENTLLDLSGAVATDINYGFADTDANGTIDAFGLSRTSFFPTTDGFSFSNFQSVQNENGLSFGMSLFAERYFTDNLSYLVDDIAFVSDGISYSASGYELSNYFRFHNTPVTLEESFKNLLNADYREWDNPAAMTYWSVKEDYREEFDSLGFQIRLRESRHKSGARKNRRFMYEEALPDIYSDRLKNGISESSIEMLKAVCRLDVLQYSSTHTERLSFSKNGAQALEKLFLSMGENRPAIMTLGDNGHAVNVVALYQSIECPSALRLAVYDSNYALKTRFVELNRVVSVNESKDSFTVSGENITQNKNPVYSYEFRYENAVLSDLKLCTVKMLL